MPERNETGGGDLEGQIAQPVIEQPAHAWHCARPTTSTRTKIGLSTSTIPDDTDGMHNVKQEPARV
jgi:hypothetical protein